MSQLINLVLALQIGAFSFGGGYAMILLRSIQKFRWLTEGQFFGDHRHQRNDPLSCC